MLSLGSVLGTVTVYIVAVGEAAVREAHLYGSPIYMALSTLHAHPESMALSSVWCIWPDDLTGAGAVC